MKRKFLQSTPKHLINNCYDKPEKNKFLAWLIPDGQHNGQSGHAAMLTVKYLTIIIALLLTLSCQTKQDEMGKDGFSTVDTFLVTFKRFYSFPEDSPDVFDRILIRERHGDSILTFKYFKDTTLTQQFNINIRQGQFRLIQDTTGSDLLVSVDTFSINYRDKKLTMYKYEKFLPPIDGDIGILLNREYGCLGYSSYSWGNQTILTKWNEKNLEKDLILLLSDSVRYLRRQEILPPPPPSGQVEKIEILKDGQELKENIK